MHIYIHIYARIVNKTQTSLRNVKQLPKKSTKKSTLYILILLFHRLQKHIQVTERELNAVRALVILSVMNQLKLWHTCSRGLLSNMGLYPP